MAVHPDLQSMNVEAIDECLDIAKYCVNATKANGGIYGFPAMLLLFCVVDALTVNSGGRKNMLDKITEVIQLNADQLENVRHWYRNLLVHQGVIALGTMLRPDEEDGKPIELNSDGEPTCIRVKPFYDAVRKLWESFDKSTLKPRVHPKNSPKTPVVIPSTVAPASLVVTGAIIPPKSPK